MITVACVLVNGYVKYTSDYVWRLRSMVKRHLRTPHTFVCLTDRKEVDADVRWIIDTPREMFPWWAKVQLFNPSLFASDELVLYLDLDVLVVGSLDEVVEHAQGEFTLIPHSGSFKGGRSLKIVPLYNSSCMVWRGEQGYHLYNAWSRNVTQRLWGDQDWIGERMPDARRFPLEWFPRLSAVNYPLAEEVKVVLSKKPKNHIAAQQHAWFRELWR